MLGEAACSIPDGTGSVGTGSAEREGAGIAERNRASMAGGGLNAAAGSRKFEYTGESVLDLAVASLILAEAHKASIGQRISGFFSGT